MVRRVKAYLKNMQVITNEDELHKMSLECEPPSGGVPHPPAATVLSTVRKRNPSPSPSAASSSSSTPSHYSNTTPPTALAGAPNKFGAASPQAVKKLLSLSEQTKPRHKTAAHVAHNSHNHSLEREVVSRAARADSESSHRPTITEPVNLTSESSSVTSRPKVRKVQNSIGSITSNDSGFGAEHHRLERCELERSESPQLPPRRRYHHHYHRQQHNHGVAKHGVGLSVHHAVPVEVCPGSPDSYLARQNLLPRVHRITPGHNGHGSPPSYYIQQQDDEDDETQVSAV